MPAKPLCTAFSSAILLCLVCSLASAREDFSGKFQGDKLAVEITAAGNDGYTGAIQMGAQKFPLKAHESAGQLVGSFTSQNSEYDFAVSPEGDAFILTTGKTRYPLKRVMPMANPLDPPQPVNPLARPDTAPAVGDPLAGYRVLSTTTSGKAFSAEKPGAANVQAALEATFPDLARYFGGRPAIGGAFEDSKSHKSGGASFTARLDGKPVRGFVSCKLVEKGAAVSVIYCQADAPQADWDKLAATLGGDVPAAAPEVKLEEYQFPDGTGSMGLAEGWKTNAASCLGGVIIKGPQDQQVSIGVSAAVVTPDSTAVQMQRQLEANARQMGVRPPPPLQTLVAPFTGPADALANLIPQISQASQRTGGPAIRLDKIIEQKKINPNLPGGNAALLSYAVTKATRGSTKQYRAAAQIETTAILQGSWMFYATELLAPAESYDRDLPVMMAMAKSMKTNDRVIQEKTRQNINAQQQNFAAMQQAHREQMDAFDRQNKAWEQRQTSQSRNNADFDEVIRGYRTVEDTQTGERTSVKLGDAHDIVDTLNEHDPGHYKEIPLRDEMYPLPPDQNK